MASDELSKFAADMHAALVEGIQVAARWLRAKMRLMVSVQCGAAGPRHSLAKSGGHSAPGQPPKMESGEGYRSIQYQPIKNGAEIGVVDIGTPKMLAGNYMAGWDSPEGIRHSGDLIGGVRRPWLSRFFTEDQYQKEFDRIVESVILLKTGMKVVATGK